MGVGIPVRSGGTSGGPTIPEGPHGMPSPRVSSPVRLPPFQTLLDAHGRDVHRFLIATVGRDDADDCYQETWLAALRAYSGLREASNLRSWILTIAHHKAIDHLRARGRRAVPAGAATDLLPAESSGHDPARTGPGARAGGGGGSEEHTSELQSPR